eukprot:gene6692-biopygen5471
MDVEQPKVNVMNDEQIQMTSASEEYTSPVVKNESDSRKNDELSTKEIMEDFERMQEIFEYHQAKNSGKQGADLYPEGYGTAEKRSLHRYANKYQLENYFMKWVEAFPIPEKSALQVAKCLVKLFCRHGAPEKVLTDQGREFVNESVLADPSFCHRFDDYRPCLNMSMTLLGV